MKRRLFITALIVLVIAAIGSAVRLQKRGYARIVRAGSSLRVLNGTIGIAPPWGATCVAVSTGSLLRFQERFDLVDAEGEPVPIEVRFDYAPPRRVPSNWPAGDWCRTFSAHVRDLAGRWLAAQPVEKLRSDPRATGVEGSATIARQLAASGIKPLLLTVRPRVSESARATLPVPAIASQVVPAPPLIFIGLDGADWQLLDRLIAAGAMPNLARLVHEGRSGVLLTQHPPLSPLLWTSMMTGTSPLVHEILDFTRFHPVSGLKEPITSDERKVPAAWNMATYGGKSSAVLGLWATYPAEPIRGMVVSDRLFTFLFSEDKPPAGTVYPQSREKWARDVLGEVERDVGYEVLKQYLPWLSADEYNERRSARDPYSHPVSALRRIVVETSVYERLARKYVSERLPDLTILYLQGTDSIGHVFAPFTAPRQPHISETDFARYANVAEMYFRQIDKIIGNFAELARARGARLMLASDHGFHWFEGRPEHLSSFAAQTAAKWHRRSGMYLLWGDGIAAAKSRSDQNAPHIAQVCATILSLSGLPQSAHIAQPPLVPASNRATIDYRSHYAPAKVAAASSAASAEEIARLRALGYIGSTEAMSAPAGVAGRSTHTAGWYNNRGLILRDQKDDGEAIAAFEHAIALDQNLSSALWNLSDLLHQRRRDLDRSDELLVRAISHGLPEGVKLLIGRAIGYQRTGSIERSLKLLESAVRVKPDEGELRMFRGRYRVEMRDCEGALADFQAATQLDPRNPVPYASAGLAELCLGRNDDARRSFARSLSLDPDQPRLRQYVNP